MLLQQPGRLGFPGLLRCVQNSVVDQLLIMTSGTLKAVAVLLDSSDEDSEIEELAAAAVLVRKRKRKLRPKSLRDFSDYEIWCMCRVHKEDISKLRIALRLPNRVITTARYALAGDDALMVTLRRFAYPCRLFDLETTFGMSPAKLSSTINTVVSMIYSKWKHLLGFHHSRFEAAKLRVYAQAIRDAGCPLRRCIGFIDGTVRPVCRPVRNQRALFSGHKRVHAVKYQSVKTPDGLISHLAGPFTGNRHDTAILAASGLLQQLRDGLRDEEGPFCIYGDGGYPISPHILSPYKGARLTEGQQQFNLRMSKVRIAVEWGFGEILQHFAFVDFKKSQRLLLQAVAKFYLVAALLCNCRVCLYGNGTSAKFNLTPPTLDEYLVL